MTTENPYERSVEFTLSDKQIDALDVLHDDVTNELVFGGGARGGKTFLGSFWIISECLSKPGSQWLVARESLKALKRTTLRTFFKVMSSMGLVKDIDFKYNAQEMVLTFIQEDSTVFFSELKRIPSDPEFDRIGSYDLTGAWLDESQEICKDAKDALQFRFTTMEGDGWVAVPKTLYTCNPSKGWIYGDFWKPIIKEGLKVLGRMFITSLYLDNPWIDHKKYHDNVIKTKNKVKIERLLKGNFEYDDDPAKIFEIDGIWDMFTNTVDASSEKYMSCDVARKGRDKTVIVIWEGFKAIKIESWDKTLTRETRKFLEDRAAAHGVRRSRIIIDEDGVGGGVVDELPGCVGFVNNSKPLEGENYSNLKTQCYFKFADFVNQGKMSIVGITTEDKELLIEEMEQIKQKHIDKDGKIALEGKEKVKEMIGRSPDIADALMMRFYFEIETEPWLGSIVI